MNDLILSQPATPSAYVLASWDEYLATFLIMFLFASCLLGVIKYFATKEEKQIIPASTTNETVTVITSLLPSWLWFIVQTVIIIAALFIVRAAFGMKFPNSYGSESMIAVIEIGIMFGLLCLSVPKLGVKAVELVAFNIVKNKLSSLKGAETVLTPEEYMKIGNIKNMKSEP